MNVKQKKLLYNVRYKLNAINYAKQFGNRAAKRHFGRPPTKKVVGDWRKQEEQLKLSSKHKKTSVREQTVEA